MIIFKALLIAAAITAAVYFAVINLVPTTADELQRNSEKLFNMINQERSGAGIQALTWDKTLAALAINHSLKMAETDIYEHSDYPYAENLMIGCDPENVFKAWKDSPLHYQNMMDPDFHYGAVGMGIINYKYSKDNSEIQDSPFIYGQSRSFTTFLASSRQPIDN